jgi:hypothetical protein
MGQDVDILVAALPEPARGMVELLRRLVADSHPDVREHVKWNGPSFVIDGDDRITLGTDKAGRARAVLHRGAKARPLEGFGFADDAGLARWVAPDRGLVEFTDLADVETRGEAFKILCRRWLDATR